MKNGENILKRIAKNDRWYEEVQKYRNEMKGEMGALILDDYELIRDEYVKKIPLLLEKEIDKYVETNIPSFFNKMGYKIKKVPTTATTATRTVDYEYEDLGLEVTSIREYLPRNDETDKLLSRHDQANSRICAYMYLKDGKPKIEILDEQRLNNNVSILCLRQHIYPATDQN
jgi:hypothetical protein